MRTLLTNLKSVKTSLLTNLKSVKTSLYESLLDDEDIQLDNMDKNLFIGGNYKIDVDGIKCVHWRNIFKLNILKYQSQYSLFDSPKITKFDDSKTNNMLESLCRIILNLPIQCITDYHKHENKIITSKATLPYIKNTQGTFTGQFTKTVGGQVYFHISSKSIKVDIGGGVKSYETPHITIPLMKK